MEHFVIIGAGQAAAQAAATLRSEGFSGLLTIIGDEPFPPYQRPPLSKAYLSGDFARERLFLKPDSFYRETDCGLRLGVAAKAIDRGAKSVRLADGGNIPYDRLLIATGTRARPIAVPGAKLKGVHYLRSIADTDLLRPALTPGARLVVVGAGYIGLEVAAVARKSGLDVTIVEAMARAMMRTVSPQLSAFYTAEHRGHGVRIELGAKVLAFEGTSRVESVTTDRGNFPADIVLAGIGALPNDELAREAGLACGNGIEVDEYTATSDPDIFAAGDCTNHPGFWGERIRLESVQNAIEQAKHAALAMLGRPIPYREVPWFWSDQYDLKLQMAGLARESDATVLRGSPESRKFSVFRLRGGAVVAVEAVNAAPDYIIGRKLIAARASVAPERLADTKIPVKALAEGPT